MVILLIALQHVPRSTQALITRAHIEMDIRLERAGRSLEEFLEGDIPCGNFKFSRQANIHLQRFRSFLQCYYIGRYGYWPPTPEESATDALPKSVYQSMYFDMRNLYEYLADKSSEPACHMEVHNEQSLDVAGNLQAFDMKNRYTALPFSLVLLPDLPEPVQRRKSLWSLFGLGRVRQERRLAAFAALKDATNHDDHRVMGSNIVREYLRFERDWTMIEDPTHTCVEARKVRWILIYSMLQTLVSIAKVPDEVRDTEGVNYPLCCQTAGTPPWADTKRSPEIIEQTPVSSVAVTPEIEVVQPEPDFSFLRPSPLKVPSTHSSTLSQRQRTQFCKPSFTARMPARASSLDFLRGTSDSFALNPHPRIRTRPFSLHTPSKANLSSFVDSPPMPGLPLSHSSSSDPSTPSSSEMEASAWSASSSEGGMDHNSVVDTDSNYGDVENDPQSANRWRMPRRPIRKLASHASMRRGNPELEAYLAA